MEFAFKKPKRLVNRVFIHCSANSNPKWGMKELEILHKERGFKTIGYHYFIDRKGNIFNGRLLEIDPEAQAGHNKNTIAICVHGGKNDKNDFVEEQFRSLKIICDAINTIYQNNVSFHGHCEVSTKACPVFDYKKVLGLDGNKIVIKYGQCNSEFLK